MFADERAERVMQLAKSIVEAPGKRRKKRNVLGKWSVFHGFLESRGISLNFS